MPRKEELLIERRPLLGSGKQAPYGHPASEHAASEIADYKVGDTFTKSFSTTSPPAFVSNDYEITRKDSKGLWGILLDSRIREMTLEEV